MEAALSNFAATIISFVVLIVGVYVVITFTVHYGLKNVITNRKLRNDIIKLVSVIAFGAIAMSIY